MIIAQACHVKVTGGVSKHFLTAKNTK